MGWARALEGRVIGKYFTNKGVKPVLYATGEGSQFFFAG